MKLPKNPNLEVPHDCGMTTRSVIEAMKEISAALTRINKSRKQIAKVVSARSAGRITAEQESEFIMTLRKRIANDLAISLEAGMALGQGDLCDHGERARHHAIDLVAADLQAIA